MIWYILNTNIYYIKLKSHLSVCPHFWHADNSVVSVRIETGLAQNKSCVLEDHKFYFKSLHMHAITHPHECAKGTGVS